MATVRGPERTALHELGEAAGGRMEIEHKLVATVDAQRGRTGLQYLDYLGQTVAW